MSEPLSGVARQSKVKIALVIALTVFAAVFLALRLTTEREVPVESEAQQVGDEVVERLRKEAPAPPPPPPQENPDPLPGNVARPG